MPGGGHSKSFIETHCSTLLWALFIPEKTTKFEIFGFIKFSKSIIKPSRLILSEWFVWLKPDRIYSFDATGTVQPPRSRSSTGKTKKKIEIESFSNGLNHRGSFCGVRFGVNFFLWSHPASFGGVVFADI